MVRGPVHRRFATKTATQRPCPELHDHKIILVLRHPPPVLPLLSSFSLRPRSPPSPDRSTRKLVTNDANEHDEGDVTTIATCRAGSESSQIYRDVLQTTYGKWWSEVIDRWLDFASNVLLVRRWDARDRVMLLGNRHQSEYGRNLIARLYVSPMFLYSLERTWDSTHSKWIRIWLS